MATADPLLEHNTNSGLDNKENIANINTMANGTNNTTEDKKGEKTTRAQNIDKEKDIKVLWVNAPVCRSVYKEVESVKHTYEEEKFFRELEYKSACESVPLKWLHNCARERTVDNHKQAEEATKELIEELKSSDTVTPLVIQVFNGHGVPDDRDNPKTSEFLYHDERKPVDEVTQRIKELVQPLIESNKVQAWWLVYGQSHSYLAAGSVNVSEVSFESADAFTVCCLTKRGNPHTMNARNMNTHTAKHFNLNKFFKSIK